MTRVAAIDCGTNSVRLLVADHGPSGLVEVRRELRLVRLGQGVDRTGRLDPAAIERTRVALVEYAELIAGLGATRIRMVATSATRDAINAGDFATMVARTLGVLPEVISGDEEARLSFAGAVAGLPVRLPPPYLVVDIGGGSTELALGNSTVEAAASVDLGSVRLTERHLRDDPPTPEQVAAAVTQIGGMVEAALVSVPTPQPHTLVGLAGSVTTVAALALGPTAALHHARVSRAEVAAVTAMLLGATVAQRLALPRMHPGRADVIAAGALILRVIMERTGAESVVVSVHDILDGIAASLR